MNFPAHRGIGGTSNTLNNSEFIWWCVRFAATHHGARIVIDTQEIKRSRDQRHISMLDRWWRQPHVTKHVLGIAATEKWVKEPAMGEGVRAFYVLQRLRTIIRGISRSKVEADTHLSFRVHM